MLILIVEDCPVNRFFLEKALQKLGHEIRCAANGVEALDYLRHELADLVLMDLKMPVMDGLEATRSILHDASSPLSEAPIIAVTACVTDAERTLCYEAGMADILSKPIIIEDLKHTIERYAASQPTA